ncbi:type IV pilus secretin PilQ [Methylomagnum sp.]
MIITAGISASFDKKKAGGRFKWLFSLLFTSVLVLKASFCGAGGVVLQSVDFASLQGDNLQFVLTLNGPGMAPRAFHTENPARIALDLPGVTNGLEKKSIPINVGGAQSLQAVEAGGRTRVVVNLTSMVPYTTKVDGNRILVTLQNGTGRIAEIAPITAPQPLRAQASSRAAVSARHIKNVDFRRGERGEGRLLITLSDPKSVVDINEEGQKVVVRFADTELPSQLSRKLDVIDFATPVQYIESASDGGDARLAVTPISDEYDYSSYQSGNLLTVEFRALTKAEKEEIKKKSFTYSGEKLTLNFQDIPVRSVLQILADFTNLNVVASDTVQGNVTLRLQDVPWDQALELVLKSKGLGKRQEGNIIRVAPLDEINKQEEDELKAQKVVEDLEPLRTEIIQINYTTADKIKEILKGTTERTSESISSTGIGGEKSATSTTALDVSQSILSGRGNVTTDPRTNQLIIKDTARNIDRVRELVRQVDKPVRQVLIESRIVVANNDFTRELGSRLSLNRSSFVQTKRGKEFFQTNPSTGASEAWQQRWSGDSATAGDALVDLASTAAAASGGSFGVTFLKVGEYLLDLELSAAQIDGRGEIVSTPKVVTADQTEAHILQGEQIPYSQNNALGASNTQFKDAVLELKVTPHITPNGDVLMDLSIKKDARGQPTPSGLAIDKREIQTTAQVGNGETVVLGGVFEGTQANNTDKVPFLGDLPGIGFMFRRDKVIDTKRELLIFITPKILDQSLAVR